MRAQRASPQPSGKGTESSILHSRLKCAYHRKSLAEFLSTLNKSLQPSRPMTIN
ncbi:hypothetical protein AZA_31979 [Nitrospirillum viridazoti Y2]|nr:hypothetical protein AZA_31979 [Nitrospirillum amazonense Y2]